MIARYFSFALFTLFWLVGCSPAVVTEEFSPISSTATVAATTEAAPAPTATRAEISPTPSLAASVETTEASYPGEGEAEAAEGAPHDVFTGSLPESRLDPGALGLAMLLQAAELVREPWQLEPCYEAAAPFCWRYDTALSGWAGMDIRRLADYYEADDPLRHAAEALPAPGEPLTADQEAAVLSTLSDQARKNLEAWGAKMSADDADCLGSELPIQPTRMGPLPAVSYGYVCKNQEGEIVDEVLWTEAFDQSRSYLLQSLASALPSPAEYSAHRAIFDQLSANLPLYDPALLALIPLPRPLSYWVDDGSFPYDAELTLAIDLPDSPATVSVLGQNVERDPLTVEQAKSLAKKYGFEGPLTVEVRSGLTTGETAAMGMFAAFDGLRTLSLSSRPYYYSDVANWIEGADPSFEEAKPIAEKFLQSNDWLDFPYEMADSDMGEGVLFLPLINGVRLPVPAYSVRAAGNGGVSTMNIYGQDPGHPALAEIGRYPILSAEMAWPQAHFLLPGTPYQLQPPPSSETAVLPTEYSNIPSPGSQGDFYTNIWAYWPLDGSEAAIIRSSDFFRVTGDPAMLNELAQQSDYLVHLWGTVHEIEPGVLELALSQWEAVPDAGGLPTFYGRIQISGGQTFLVDDANQMSYLLPDAPVELFAEDYVAVSGLPVREDDADQLMWQKVTVYLPSVETEALPTAEPIKAVTITGAELVYLNQPSDDSELPERLFIPAWEFTGVADNGWRVTIWVPALFPEFFMMDMPARE